MGFAITWCAIREEAADRFLEALGLRPTGEIEGFPDSLITIGRLDTGWRVLWYNNFPCPFLKPEDLAGLSAGRDLLVCQVDEHTMTSSSAWWSDGVSQWRLEHLGEDGPSGLSVVGEPPACLPPIRKEMEERQQRAGGADAGVDYMFEIPLMVAKSLVGFKHDENCPHLIGRHFVVMTGAPETRGLLSRIFRR